MKLIYSRMIFRTWRSFFICWQIFENKLWFSVSKKTRSYFHFLISLPCGFDHFYGAGRRGDPPPPRGAVRPSLEDAQVQVCSLSWIIQHKNCKYLDWCQVCLKKTIVIILIFVKNRCTMKHQLYQFNDNKTFNKYISSSSLT